jgi:endonuclease YncB( thermonuclease family)
MMTVPAVVRRTLSVCALLLAVPAFAGVFLGNVVIVVDGDTLVVRDERAVRREVRLAGIDAPELRQTCRDADGRDWSCGAAARMRLAGLVAKGWMSCTPQGEDRYGRLLATCSSGAVADIGAALVRDGYAVNYSRYTSDYAAAEHEARAARRGVWQGAFDNPEEWRHAKRR